MIRKYSKLFAIAAAVGLSVVPVSAKEITFDELQDLISETTSYETEAKAVHIIGEHVFTNLIGDNYDDEDVIAAMESINNVPSAKHSYFLYTYGDEGWTLSSQVGNKEGKLNEPFNITTIDTIAIEDSTSNAIKTAREEAIDAIERYRKNLLDNSKYDQDALDKVVETYTNEINKANTIKDINDNITEAVKEMEAARIKKEDSIITIDTVAEAEDSNYMKENWKYDSALNNQLESKYDESTKTLTFTGNVAHMPEVNETAFSNEAELTGYYLTYTLHIPEEYNTDNLVITVKSPLKEATYGKQDNGTLTVLNSINPDDYTTKGKVTITVDFDGEGELYGETTYTIDYTGVKLGKISELNLDKFDVGSETYLKQSYNWEKPDEYLTFTADEKTNTVKVSGTLSKYATKLEKAGFGESDTQYYLGFKISVKTLTNLNENMKTSNVAITVGKTNITKDNFDNESDVFTLFMLNPANTPKENRIINITVDKDGEGLDYSATTYTLDWSDVKFTETSTLKEISTVIPESDKKVFNDWGYEVNNKVNLQVSTQSWIYNATGTVTEQPNVTAFEEKERTGFYFTYNLLLNVNTNLNGTLTKEDLKNIQIKIKNSANGKEKIIGADALTFGEDGSVSLAMLTHINPNDSTKTIDIYVDFDGTNKTFESSWYQIKYDQLKLQYKTSLKVNEVKTGSDAATELENNYGFKVEEAGRITLNSSIDEKGNSAIYAHGFALQTKLGTEELSSVFGADKDNGYYLPLNFEISHASKIKSITFKDKNSSNIKELSETELNEVKSTGKLNALVILAGNDGNRIDDKDKLTIEVVYDAKEETETLAEQKITIDTSDVKLGAKGLYEVAYNTTISNDYKIAENTTIIYGSDKITEETQPRVKNDLYKSILINILTKDHIKSEKVVEFNQNGTSKITFAVNGGHFNDEVAKLGFTGTRKDGREGFFDDALKFTVEIDANNHITSIVSETLTLSKEISEKNKYVEDSYEYVVKSIEMNFVLSDFTKKTDVKVELTQENTVPKKAEAFSTKYYKQSSNANKNIKFGDEEFDVASVYTKIGKVENVNVESILLSDKEYKNKNVSISVDLNSFIVAPIFVVMDDELYVSTTHLMALNKAEVEVVYDGVTYTVTTGIKEENIKELTIDAVSIALGDENSETNSVSYDKDTNTITHKSNNGTNAIYIDLKYNNELLSGTTNYIYSLSENGNMGITAMEENHTYEVYTLAYGKTVTATDSYEQKQTLIVPNKGSVTFTLNVVAIPAD